MFLHMTGFLVQALDLCHRHRLQLGPHGSAFGESVRLLIRRPGSPINSCSLCLLAFLMSCYFPCKYSAARSCLPESAPLESMLLRLITWAPADPSDHISGVNLNLQVPPRTVQQHSNGLKLRERHCLAPGVERARATRDHIGVGGKNGKSTAAPPQPRLSTEWSTGAVRGHD